MQHYFDLSNHLSPLRGHSSAGYSTACSSIGSGGIVEGTTASPPHPGEKEAACISSFSFTEELQSDGYIIVKIPPYHAKCLEELYKAAREFFDSPRNSADLKAISSMRIVEKIGGHPLPGEERREGDTTSCSTDSTNNMSERLEGESGVISETCLGYEVRQPGDGSAAPAYGGATTTVTNSTNGEAAIQPTETYTVRLPYPTSGLAFPWPFLLDDFPVVVEKAFQAYLEIGTMILHELLVRCATRPSSVPVHTKGDDGQKPQEEEEEKQKRMWRKVRDFLVDTQAFPISPTASSLLSKAQAAENKGDKVVPTAAKYSDSVLFLRRYHGAISSASAHTDSGILTILPCPDVQGLQVLTFSSAASSVEAQNTTDERKAASNENGDNSTSTEDNANNKKEELLRSFCSWKDIDCHPFLGLGEKKGLRVEDNRDTGIDAKAEEDQESNPFSYVVVMLGESVVPLLPLNYQATVHRVLLDEKDDPSNCTRTHIRRLTMPFQLRSTQANRPLLQELCEGYTGRKKKPKASSEKDCDVEVVGKEEVEGEESRRAERSASKFTAKVLLFQ